MGGSDSLTRLAGQTVPPEVGTGCRDCLRDPAAEDVTAAVWQVCIALPASVENRSGSNRRRRFR